MSGGTGVAQGVVKEQGSELVEQERNEEATVAAEPPKESQGASHTA